jgi:hypothetical protein
VDNLQQYNAFGSVAVKKDRITLTLTAAKDGKAIHRVLGKDVQLSQVLDYEVCVAEIGVLIEETKFKVIAYEIVKPKSKARLLDIPEIKQAVQELVNIVRKAIL